MIIQDIIPSSTKIKSFFKKKSSKLVSVFLILFLLFQIIAGAFLPVNFKTAPPYIYSVEEAQAAGESWYNASWLYRIKITVLATKVDADITNFPVYVNLANLPAGFHTNVNQTDARDIRVTTANGITEVPREVVSYNSATDSGELHFKGDILNATDVDFYIYYGNAAASDYAVGDTYGRNDVWETSAKGVWHLNETVTDEATLADAHSDSTVNANHGDQTGNDDGTGQILNGQSFDGVDDYISLNGVSNMGLTNYFTVSGWFNSRSISSVQTIYTNAPAINSMLGIKLNGSKVIGAIYNGGVYVGETRSDSTLLSDVWYFFSYIHNSDGTAKLYINGILQGSASGVGMSLWYDTPGHRIGRRAYNGSEGDLFNGFIDETRIYSRALSAEEISTQYNNQNSPSTFYSVGSEQSLPAVQFTLTSSSGSESITPAQLQLTLSAVFEADVTVNYAITGGTAAGSGTDYTLASGTSTITAGNTTTAINAVIVNDSTDELDETFIVSISSPVNAVLGANTAHTYTIQDNDEPPSSGGGLPSAAYSSPASPEDGFSISINNGDLQTDIQNVTLKFNAGTDTKRVAISEDPDFKNASQEEYAPIKIWTLSESEGIKIIYAKFYTVWGQPSKAVSRSIVYRKNPTISSSSNTLTDSNVSNTSNYIFSRNLKLGDKGADVKELQKFLNGKGFIVAVKGPGSPGNETEIFGFLTKKSLIKFQKASNLPAIGYFGEKTRKAVR